MRLPDSERWPEIAAIGWYCCLAYGGPAPAYCVRLVRLRTSHLWKQETGRRSLEWRFAQIHKMTFTSADINSFPCIAWMIDMPHFCQMMLMNSVGCWQIHSVYTRHYFTSISFILQSHGIIGPGSLTWLIFCSLIGRRRQTFSITVGK